jgi:FAD:protein FMN transferase
MSDSMPYSDITTVTSHRAALRLPVMLWIVAAVFALPAICCVATARANEDDLSRHEFTSNQMGTLFRIVLYAKDAETARRASDAAFARVKELNAMLSDYEAESEINRLTAKGPTDDGVKVSPELWTLLSRSQRLAEQTDGAFDVTVGPYSRLWRRARRQKELPSAERMAEAKAVVGYRNLELLPGREDDLRSGYVRLKKDRMRLDLGGIAKGFAADEALAVLRKAGIAHAMVAASGDMAFGEPPPGETGWRIGIAPLSAESDKPSRFLRLSNCGVSTSGDAFQHVEIGGKRYSHIIDPRTGLGLTEQSSVTIVAPNATTADSVATAVSVIGEPIAKSLLAKYPGTEMLFVRRDGEKILATPSAGFEKHLDSKKPKPPAN